MADANRKATRTGDAKFSYVDTRTIVNDEIIYVGEMVEAVTSSDEVGAATDNTGRVVLGVSTKYIDNADDGETLNDISTAVHLLDNGGDVTVDHIGQQCFVVDAASVAMGVGLQSNANIAGIVTEVTSDGVFVDFDPAKKRL